MRHLIVITTLLILCSKKAACIVDDVLHVVTEKIILFEWLNLRTQASYVYLILCSAQLHTNNQMGYDVVSSFMNHDTWALWKYCPCMCDVTYTN